MRAVAQCAIEGGEVGVEVAPNGGERRESRCSQATKSSAFSRQVVHGRRVDDGRHAIFFLPFSRAKEELQAIKIPAQFSLMSHSKLDTPLDNQQGPQSGRSLQIWAVDVSEWPATQSSKGALQPLLNEFFEPHEGQAASSSSSQKEKDIHQRVLRYVREIDRTSEQARDPRPARGPQHADLN